MATTTQTQGRFWGVEKCSKTLPRTKGLHSSIFFARFKLQASKSPAESCAAWSARALDVGIEVSDELTGESQQAGSKLDCIEAVSQKASANSIKKRTVGSPGRRWRSFKRKRRRSHFRAQHQFKSLVLEPAHRENTRTTQTPALERSQERAEEKLISAVSSVVFPTRRSAIGLLYLEEKTDMARRRALARPFLNVRRPKVKVRNLCVL